MQFKDVIMQTVTSRTENLGASRLIDENRKIIWAALQAKNQVCTDWQDDSSSVYKKISLNLQSKVEVELQEMQRKAEQVKCYADTHATREFFSAI